MKNNRRLARIFCAVFRHSNIIENCIGYKYCARCGVQLGDSLGGVYSNEKAVAVGHGCDKCEENWKRLTWVDRFLCPPKKAVVYDALGGKTLSEFMDDAIKELKAEATKLGGSR